MADLETTILTIFASAFLSGLAGIAISEWYHKRNERRREKFEILKQLMGNRFDLGGNAFSEALNSVFIVFHDSTEVKKALMEFHRISMNPSRTNTDSNQRLLELFKAMSKDLKVSTEPLTDNYFLEAYNIRQPQRP
ncbi:MAG TPA: DUF6680 family protein [Candidatus Sulfotelmatobacter sp.]|nr:DUF6680 family protein [Candidatus Sulfotelmatobacter sp.]